MKEMHPHSGRVEWHAGSHLVGGGNRAKSANDCLEENQSKSKSQTAKRTYVTRARTEAIGEQLKRRQRSVVHDVDRLGVVTGRQLQRLHYGTSPAGARLARKHLSQLVHWRVLGRLKRSVGGVRRGSAGYVYALGPVGQRLVQPGRSRYREPWTPRESFMRHALAISELYTELRERESADVELLNFDSEPGCWRRYFGPGGARSMLKPDAFVVLGLGDVEDRYFIEMDCGTEPGPRLLTKAKAYIRYWQSGREQAESEVFPYVLWIGPDERRADFIVGVLSGLPAEQWQIFQVATAGSAVKHMTMGEPVTITNRKEVT